MGDNLPELLYRTHCSAAGVSYGSDECLSWHNLPTDVRYAWEQVAAKARNEMHGRVLAELDSTSREFGAVESVSVEFVSGILRERWGRR